MKRVLIAEDHAINRELLRELLESRGYTVFEACNGLDALQAIERSQPDILLLDINMPVLDGIATLRKIRDDPSLGALPVLAVTAYAMQGDRDRVLDAGFDGYLSKPVNSSLLEQELARLLSKNHHGAVPTQAADAAANEK